jgi:hypothetical protein
MPEWLTDALLVLLTDEAEGGPLVIRLRQRWAKRRQDAIDAARAQTVAFARTHPDLPPQTLEMAHLLAERYVRSKYPNVSAVGPEAIKKAYRLVCQRLRSEGRYYDAPDDFADRLQRARESLLRLIEADLRRGTPDNPGK